MAQQKSFWKTTPGILVGCGILVVVLLVCGCGAIGLLIATGNFDTSSVTGPATIITNVVMSRDVQGDTYNPVGITDSFAANQSIFHAIVTIKDAPKGTVVKAVWSTTTGQSMGEYEIATEGSRNLDFTFKPEGGALPGGTYRVGIFLNNKIERTMDFSVAFAPASSSAASKSSISSSSSSSVVSKLPTAGLPTASSSSSSVVSKSSTSSAVPKSTGLVASVTMAENTQGENKDPVNPTTVFKPGATFHAVVRTQNAPANTRYQIVWYASDVGNAAAPNTQIDATEINTNGTRNIDFTLEPISTWPPGTYRAEISVNGVLDTIKTFSVSASTSQPSSSTSSAPTTLTECGTIPAGQGGLLVVNYYGQQMNYTIGGTLHKIDGNGRKAIFLAPGKQNYSANIPGVGESQGTLDIVAGQCFTQSWANR